MMGAANGGVAWLPENVPIPSLKGAKGRESAANWRAGVVATNAQERKYLAACGARGGAGSDLDGMEETSSQSSNQCTSTHSSLMCFRTSFGARLSQATCAATAVVRLMQQQGQGKRERTRPGHQFLPSCPQMSVPGTSPSSARSTLILARDPRSPFFAPKKSSGYSLTMKMVKILVKDF